MYALKFFREFLNSPGDVGAIAASSKELAEEVARAAGVERASTVVEFGPGTGSITEAILGMLPQGATFFGIEKSEDFVATLRKRFPEVPVHLDSATNTRHYLEQLGLDSCDCIVSGLPWAAFPPELQDALFDTVVDVLTPEGGIAFYMYISSHVVPSAHRFRKRLRELFHHSGRARTVWKNLPPAIVYYARNPRKQ